MNCTLVVLVADEDADKSSLFLEAFVGGSDVAFFFFFFFDLLWTFLCLFLFGSGLQLGHLSFLLEVVQPIGVIPLLPH